MSAKPVLDIRGLKIAYGKGNEQVIVVPEVDLSVEPGEALGLVGESGCGKSTIAMAILGYLGRDGSVLSGIVSYQGRDLQSLSSEELRCFRGKEVGIVYQDPLNSLNPVMRIGPQLLEGLRTSGNITPAAARERALKLLDEVKLPNPERIMKSYPHQLSGGQQQRVVIAMSLMTDPSLLVLDEPTTGLDVTVEASVIELLQELRSRRGLSMLFISHNLRTVAKLCDKIMVLYAGEAVEEGHVEQVFGNPSHPYTRGLLDCMPDIGANAASRTFAGIPGDIGSVSHPMKGCSFAPRCQFATDECREGKLIRRSIEGSSEHTVLCCQTLSLSPPSAANTGVEEEVTEKFLNEKLDVSGIRRVFQVGSNSIFKKPSEIVALDNVSLKVSEGGLTALVGESGSGKSTLARIISGLDVANEGEILLDKKTDIAKQSVVKRGGTLRRAIQMVFQNPDSTLNPYHSIGYSLERSVKCLQQSTEKTKAEFVRSLMNDVGLPVHFSAKRPRNMSGGQKQRVAIARALAGEPELLIADEPVSALDVSIQADIMNLICSLQSDKHMTILMVSHDLALVRYVADFVAVMYSGRIVEYGSANEVFSPPYHPYTELLIRVAAGLPISEKSEGDGQSPAVGMGGHFEGCPFTNRCNHSIAGTCSNQPVPVMDISSTHTIQCHMNQEDFPTEVLASK